MIDIHTHILPFVDDGSKSLESSIKLIQESVMNGVSDLFLTPHYMLTRNYLSNFDANQAIFDSLCKEVEKQQIPIHLHLGNEVYYQFQSIDDFRKGRIVPLGKTNKVLIEFSTTEEEEDICEAIHNMKALGYQPILAHVERYTYIKDFHDYDVIHRMGALIQVNAESVVGASGSATKKQVFKMIQKGYVDFIASDIHEFRTNYMKQAYDMILKKFKKGTADKLFNNPIMFQ